MTTQQVNTSSISINQLLIPLSTGIGLSPFSLPSQPCHILLTVRSHLLPHCLKPSSTDEHGVIDDWDTLGLGKSVNYSALGKVLYKEVASACEQGKVRSLEELADFVAQLCGKEYPSSLQGLDIQVERPRALLFAESVLVQKSFTFQYPANTSSSTEPPSFNNFRSSGVSLQARNIQVETIIGLHPHERAENQKLELDVEIDLAALAEELPASGFDYKTFASSAQEVRSIMICATHIILLKIILLVVSPINHVQNPRIPGS
jgi:dihydroneopterin aldolase